MANRQLLLSRTGQRVDEALVQEVDEFRRLVRDGRDPLNQGRSFGNDVRRIFDVFLARNVPSQGESIFTFVGTEPYRSTVTESQGRRLTSQLASLARVQEPERGEVETGIGRLRYIAVPVTAGGRRRGAFVVAVDLAGEEAEVGDALQITAGVSFVVLLIAGALAWLLAGRLLVPIRSLTETARGISESDLTRRIDVRGDDEIAELARTFNSMLDRLERAFDSQRAFVSDAGHELRTPITIIRGHLELLDEDPDERAETIALVTDELDRMSRFVDDLLTLAKAERGDFLQLGPVDLEVLTQELMAKASALAPREWELERAGNGRLVADRQRVTQAVMSLANNAVQHTEPGDCIRLGSEFHHGRVRVWVTDTGCGIAQGDQERIFERFARGGGGRRRSEGAGLGLSIVRAIAESHGGTVEVRSRPGRGATFVLSIPPEPPTEGRPR